MNTQILIQARSNSTRLPEKIYNEINGISVLEVVYFRCSSVFDTTVIVPENDYKLIKFCEDNFMHYITGSETDLVSRHFEAARILEADTIVRITSDCPLIVPSRILEMVREHNSKRHDWTTNWPFCADGHDIDIFSERLLTYLFEHSTEREHVGLCLKKDLGYKNIKTIKDFSVCFMQENYLKEWFPKLSIDTYEDYKRVLSVFEKLNSEGDKVR